MIYSSSADVVASDYRSCLLLFQTFLYTNAVAGVIVVDGVVF